MKFAFLLGALFFAPASTPVGPPTIKDFDMAIKASSDFAEKWDKEEFYEGTTIKRTVDAETIKVIPFKDAPTIDKDIFMITQALNLTMSMGNLESAFKEELEKVAGYPEQGDVESDGDKLATQEQVKEYIKKIREIRRKMAVKVEKVSKEKLEKHKDTIPVEQAEKQMELLKKYHDEQKLIDR